MKPKEAGNVFSKTGKGKKPVAPAKTEATPPEPKKPEAKQDEWLSINNDLLFTPVGYYEW